MRTLIKRFIKRCAQCCGLDVVSAATSQHWTRQSLTGALDQLARLNIDVTTVIDVGAAHGQWSSECASVLPDAKYILLEPLEEYTAQSDIVIDQLSNAVRVNAAAGARAGRSRINVHPDLVGSSLYLENEASDVNGVPREIDIVTLDDLAQDRGWSGPYVLKIDAQGAELDVLNGAQQLLEDVTYIVVECSLFNFYDNGVDVTDIINFLHDRGFALYDIFALSYRPADGALAQADFCFVKRDGPLRAVHYFATAAQREALTARLRTMNQRIPG